MKLYKHGTRYVLEELKAGRLWIRPLGYYRDAENQAKGIKDELENSTKSFIERGYLDDSTPHIQKRFSDTFGISVINGILVARDVSSARYGPPFYGWCLSRDGTPGLFHDPECPTNPPTDSVIEISDSVEIGMAIARAGRDFLKTPRLWGDVKYENRITNPLIEKTHLPSPFLKLFNLEWQKEWRILFVPVSLPMEEKVVIHTDEIARLMVSARIVTTTKLRIDKTKIDNVKKQRSKRTFLPKKFYGTIEKWDDESGKGEIGLDDGEIKIEFRKEAVSSKLLSQLGTMQRVTLELPDHHRLDIKHRENATSVEFVDIEIPGFYEYRSRIRDLPAGVRRMLASRYGLRSLALLGLVFRPHPWDEAMLKRSPDNFDIENDLAMPIFRASLFAFIDATNDLSDRKWGPKRGTSITSLWTASRGVASCSLASACVSATSSVGQANATPEYADTLVASAVYRGATPFRTPFEVGHYDRGLANTESWRAAVADLKWVIAHPSSDLIHERLWPINHPIHRNYWITFREGMTARSSDWSFWFEWYSSKLRGRPLRSLNAKQTRILELQIADIDPDFWKESSPIINRHVNVLLEKVRRH